MSTKTISKPEITADNIDTAEKEVWAAILSFANNKDDAAIRSELAENISIELINLKNLCFMSGVASAEAK